MTLAAGKLIRRIVIQRDTAGQDALGNDSSNWNDLGAFSAAISFGAAAERRQAADDSASQAATFYVRRNPATQSVTEADRILWNGLVWNIVGAVPVGLDGISITAAAAAQGGGI